MFFFSFNLAGPKGIPVEMAEEGPEVGLAARPKKLAQLTASKLPSPNPPWGLLGAMEWTFLQIL